MKMIKKKFNLNKYIVLVLAFIILINFYLAPKSIVAYNTKNLTATNVIAKNDTVKSVNTN